MDSDTERENRMLTPYANQATKQIIVSLAASKGFAETLLKSEDYRNKDAADRYLEIARKNLQLAINSVCEGLDEDQYSGIMRFANNSQISVVPKYSPSAERSDYIVSMQNMATLLHAATGDCAFCDKDEKEQGNCEIRRALLESQVIPGGRGIACPYRD